MAKYFTVKGIFKRFAKDPKNTVGIESFTKIVKEELTQLNITHSDACCPLTDFRPVRWNVDLAQLEYLSDAEAGTYTPVS